MYIENLREFLLNLNFIEDKTGCELEEDGGMFYRKINENIQLFIVSTANDWVFFISEHYIKTPNPNKFFEDDYDNINIISEYLTLEEFNDVLKKWGVI
jgi:hypothetical protein